MEEFESLRPRQNKFLMTARIASFGNKTPFKSKNGYKYGQQML